MTVRLAVLVHATDQLSEVALKTQLRWQPQIELVDDTTHPDVIGVVAVEKLNEDGLQVLRTVNRRGCQRIVLVTTELDNTGLLAAIDSGVHAVVLRKDATPERLGQLVSRASMGEGSLPPDMLGKLFKQVSQLQRNVLAPMGYTFTGLTPREVEVLRLVADGLDTQEIADQLRFSERTIKNVLHDITSRFHLKNRSHAVAYAMREGLI
jgi:DNA-binding NarL/FixJ family response regulator